jgi:Caspase domain/Putative peptidoglycan binding domain
LRNSGACAAIALAVVVLPRAAAADVEKRVALVIGNGDYKTAPHLDNPSIDAKAVAASLKRLGFQVIEGYDMPIAQMRGSVAEFSAALPDAKAAVVYYAGHGVSVDEENYILPTDIVLKNPTDLDLGAISISLILKQMKREERVNVVILDACRDNPFAADLAHSRSRSIVGERGLSRVDGDLARGTLIAFASDPKSTALDGPAGEHSPFTKALIDHIEDPGVPIDTVMNRVRSQVWEATKNKQLPWVNTSIIGEFSLNPKAAPAALASLAPVETAAPSAAAAAPDKLTQENLLWESAQHSNLPGDYQAYLNAYPGGVYAPMARNRIASLNPAADSSAGRVASVVPQASAAVSPTDLKAEIGTTETEKALRLSVADRKEVQQRLSAIAFDAGSATGVFSDKTRMAIANWQKKHQLTPTSWLGPMQVAALRAESETAYQGYLAALPASAAPTRMIQAPVVRKAPIVVQKTRERVPAAGRRGPAQGGEDNGAASAAAGAFFGGVASGLILKGLNH